MKQRFEWDEAKNQSNLRKHGVTFEDASYVFEDPYFFSVQDRFVNGEERWQTFGMINNFLVLIIAHTALERLENGELIEVIRIISARQATKHERRNYEDEIRKLYS